MTAITFQGWNRDYRITNPDTYRAAIDGAAKRWRGTFTVQIKDPNWHGYGPRKTKQRKVKGDSITHTVNRLRLERLKVPGGYGDQVKMFEALGYRVDDGINERGQKCMVVWKQEVKHETKPKAADGAGATQDRSVE